MFFIQSLRTLWPVYFQGAKAGEIGSLVTFDLYFFGIRGEPVGDLAERVSALDQLLFQNLGAYKVAGYFESL